MPPSISRTPDFSNQIAFPLEVREIGIPLYINLICNDRIFQYTSLKMRIAKSTAVEFELNLIAHNIKIHSSEFALH